MKKIVMCLLLVAGMFSAQAAVCKWAVANLYTPTADILSPGTTGGGSKMDTGANLTIELFWNADGGDSWTKITDGSLTAAGAMSAVQFWDQDTAVANRNADGNAYFKAVFNYSDATGDYSVEKLSGVKSLKNITSGAVTVTFAMNNTTWDYTPAGTPEPTSGLLLLLGGAMLALRRKQK